MITGFNTDVEHDGIVYHVQTEDKGLASPLILTLVYTGGTILASKRATYEDLIAEGFDEKLLVERLNRQHKLVCAAIRTGRIEDLKRMTERDAAERAAKRATATKPKVEPDIQPSDGAFADTKVSKTITPRAAMPKETAPVPVALPIIAAPSRERESMARKTASSPPLPSSGAQNNIADFARAETTKHDLQLSLLEEKEFHGGEDVTLGVRVYRGTNGNEAVPAAEIAIKILGSTFRPLLFSAKTNSQGIATVHAQLPHFTSGRAAILVRATLKGCEAELRRIIYQG